MLDNNEQNISFKSYMDHDKLRQQLNDYPQGKLKGKRKNLDDHLSVSESMQFSIVAEYNPNVLEFLQNHSNLTFKNFYQYNIPAQFKIISREANLGYLREILDSTQVDQESKHTDLVKNWTISKPFLSTQEIQAQKSKKTTKTALLLFALLTIIGFSISDHKYASFALYAFLIVAYFFMATIQKQFDLKRATDYCTFDPLEFEKLKLVCTHSPIVREYVEKIVADDRPLLKIDLDNLSLEERYNALHCAIYLNDDCN